MVLRFSNAAVLLCFVFLLYDGGNATRDFDDKHVLHYFHKKMKDESKDVKEKYDKPYFQKSSNDETKDVEDKYAVFYFHKTTGDKLNDLEGQYVRPYFQKIARKSTKDLEDKYAHVYFQKKMEDKTKDVEDKYAVFYFHKNTKDEMKDEKEKYVGPYIQKSSDDKTKDVEDKFARIYFHKNTEDETKDIEDNFARIYFHKNTEGETKDMEDNFARIYFHKNTEDETKDVKDKFARIYFHKNTKDETKDVEDKFARIYFHKNTEDETKDVENNFARIYFHKNTEDETKDMKDKFGRIYFHKNTEDEMKDQNMEHESHNDDKSAEIGIFTIDELRGFSVGKKLPIFLPIKNHALYPPFLPKQLAENIPFSSSKLSNILQFFSVSPDSPKGKAVQDTLKKCELEAAEGETKFCATSLESLHDFLSNAFGPDVDFKSLSTTHPTLATPISQNYTVLESPQEIESAKKVACHPMPYLYAVYFCHFDATETKAFKLQLIGDITGDKVDALVLCHMDTSGWSSDHVAFRMLGIKQGDAICHVFSQGNLVWINNPMPPRVAVSAM